MGRRGAAWLAALAVSAWLVVHWLGLISGSAITKDAAQTLRMALNLEREGVMSLDGSPPLTPSMYREPLPVWFTAAAIKAVDRAVGAAPAESYFEGDRARYLKYSNLFWFAALSAASFWACFVFTSSVGLSTLVALLVNLRLPMTDSGALSLGLDNLYSEQSAAALLMLASLFLALAVARGRISHAAGAGCFLGLLTLTKAVTLYIFVGLWAVLVCLPFSVRLAPNRLSWKSLLALTIAYCAVVSPWLYRNYSLFGSWQVAERGGIVLYVRAVKNQMTLEEALGSFYIWAPGMSGLIGRVLGFSESDRREGGRLQRLIRGAHSGFAERDRAAELAGNPDGAISFYRRARAERVRVENELIARGVPNASVESDRLLQREAFALIREHPGRHLAMIVPFVWRGAFTASIALLACCAYALGRRRTDLAMFCLPSIGTIAFYAVFTHFISRYAVPVVPIAVASGVVLLHAVWELGRQRVGGRRAIDVAIPAPLGASSSIAEHEPPVEQELERAGDRHRSG